MRLVIALLRKSALTVQPPKTTVRGPVGTATPIQLPPPRYPVQSPTSGHQRHRRLVEALFGKYLIWTNTVSCGLLMAAGDAVAQRIETRHERSATEPTQAAADRTPFDWRRSGIMFLVGFTQGPVQHWFYGWLDRRFLEVTARNVAKKVALDQSIMSPVAIVMFFMTAGTLEGQSVTESATELRSKFLTVFMSDCMFWPFVQFINFTFTPAPYRVMYINVLTMIYNVWLSIVKHNDDIGTMVQFGQTTEDTISPAPESSGDAAPPKTAIISSEL